MTEVIIVIVAVLWSGMMYVIGVENGEAKFINGYKKDHPEIKHFEHIHFAAVTSDQRKFVYCPVGNIVSWSEGDHDNKWCHWCKEYFENKDIGGIHLTGVNKVTILEHES